jgi:hypothetical protein
MSNKFYSNSVNLNSSICYSLIQKIIRKQILSFRPGFLKLKEKSSIFFKSTKIKRKVSYLIYHFIESNKEKI